MANDNKPWDGTEVSNLFKVKYDRLLMDLYNNENTLLGKLRKNENKEFVGSQIEMPVNFGFAGGVGSGSIPSANPRNVNKMILTRKKVYAKGLIDRESLKAASKAPNAGAFVKFTEEPAKAAVESFMRNLSRILFGSGDGSLGTVDAVIAVTGANPYVVTLAPNQTLANYEESDYLNFDTGTDNFELIELIENGNVSGDEATIEVLRLSGSDVPATSDIIYMQGSKDNDPHGLNEVLNLTSGSHDSIAIGRRWKAEQEDAGGATLDYDLIVKVALEIKRKTGHMPDSLVVPYRQLQKLLIALEDQKNILVPAVPKDIKGKMGLTNVSVLIPGGNMEVMAERFMKDDQAYFINTDKRFLSLEMTPDSMGFVDDFQGSIFHSEHINGNDQYSIYYALYGQFKIVPTVHGIVTNLSVLI